MDVIIGVITAAAFCLPAGFYAGVKATARHADRLLAAMTDDQIVTTARKARARREFAEAGSA